MRALRRALSRPSKGFVVPPFWAADAPVYWTPLRGDVEGADTGFEATVRAAYRSNGIVFACILARQLVFSEARFQWQRLEGGRPTDLFGDQTLTLLEKPWPNGTTGELLARMEQDVSLAGNFYATAVGPRGARRIRRMRPDWVTIVTGVPESELTPEERADQGFTPDPFDLRARPVSYLYAPRSAGGKLTTKPTVLLPEQVCHWSPIPDPEQQWRGMSWLNPVIDEVRADKAATRHKMKFFENGATIGHIVTYDKGVSREQFEFFVEHFRNNLVGVDKAYRTLHLGGGADVKTIGTDLRQLEFKVTQGAGETRIAAAARVHPVIVGLSEGMQGSSLNAGNFNSARRLFADGTIRPQWRSAAAALESIAPPPAGARLWYDDRDVPFLREDAKEEAEIRQKDATTIETLVRAGYKPDTVVQAVLTGDLRKLSHTDLFSVQLQPPDSGSANGSAPTLEETSA